MNEWVNENNGKIREKWYCGCWKAPPAPFEQSPWRAVWLTDMTVDGPLALWLVDPGSISGNSVCVEWEE